MHLRAHPTSPPPPPHIHEPGLSVGSEEKKQCRPTGLNPVSTTGLFTSISVFTRDTQKEREREHAQTPVRMEEQQNDALLERAPSTETMPQPRRNSNAKAAKVAGLAVLACLLLAGQAFTAYYVMAQKDHLKSLEQGQETLRKALSRSFSGAPKMMHSPMSKMPLLVGLDEDSTGENKKIPLTRLHASSQREGSGIMDGTRYSPKRMAMPMNSMPLLGEIKEVEESEIPETLVESKCQVQAGKVMPGFFQPQCDEEGNFKPMQCWHATGYCWCVDKDGKEIPETLTRDRPDCGNVN